MVEINLLPWRRYVYAKKQRKLKSFYLSIAALLGLIVLCAHLILMHKIKNKTNYNADLDSQLSAMTSATHQRSRSLRHNENIGQKIYATQQWVSALFTKMGYLNLYHIQLIKMHYANDNLSLSGRMHSMTDLLRWVSELNAKNSNRFKTQIVNIKNIEKSDAEQFDLDIQ
ncbi:MAG: hypothetical protein ABI597_10920 [Gammaproteobacteria bacterium]